ncbi:MAG: alcohol dehydrogenase [Dehalococcoidia bacterium]|nr:alcohol dehydrogenase [Dehalococcoidia bacterium]MSQ16698.1 alcohol dehydrogenase [Dehalococcoidia bacterium]
MRALVLEQPGRPPKLAVKQVPDPVPQPGEALVRVTACGFCHHDLLVMSGVLRRGVRPGVVLGHEISGVVAAVGPRVTALRPGDRVVSLLTNACGLCDRCLAGREHRCRSGEGIGHGRDGGFAEYVALNAASLVALPAGLDLVGAALLACPMGVTLQALERVAQVQPGETVLVTGATGGLGVHAVQAAALLGARVLAATSSPHKASHLPGLGAAEVIEVEPATAGSGMALDFSEVVRAFTADQGVDVILDTVGSPLFPQTWRSLAQYGRWVVLGEVAPRGRVTLDLAEVIFRDAQVLGSAGVSQATVQRGAALVAQGRWRPLVSQALPLEDAARAFELLSTRQVLGRLVLAP